MTTFRTSCVACLAILFWLSMPVSGLVLLLDTGSPEEGMQSGPVSGYNPLVSVYPTETVSLYVWAVPEADSDRVVASLGHNIVKSGSAEDSITCTAYVMVNDYVGTRTRWNGIALAGGLNVEDMLVSDQRAVFVPADGLLDGGIGSALLTEDEGYDPASGAVYVGRLDLAIDANAPVNSSVELRFSVGPLRIAQVTTGTWTDEPLFFGYYGGIPEAADGSGSDEGATSDAADATLFITSSPADFDTDGDVDVDDFTIMSDCLAGPAVAASAPCQNADLDQDGDVDLDDFSIFQMMFTGSN